MQGIIIALLIVGISMQVFNYLKFAKAVIACEEVHHECVLHAVPVKQVEWLDGWLDAIPEDER